ncbi:MAG: hypothetical protein LBP63_10020 [Prevotellaceae bacterium]|jgi:hypothetical protein|nr:hypothetical protein [Prevotellaceae bacterium]
MPAHAPPPAKPLKGMHYVHDCFYFFFRVLAGWLHTACVNQTAIAPIKRLQPRRFEKGATKLQPTTKTHNHQQPHNNIISFSTLWVLGAPNIVQRASSNQLNAVAFREFRSVFAKQQ